MRVAALVLGLGMLCALPFGSLRAGSSLKVIPVPVPGASGAANNAVFAFDRYVILAPFLPSGEVSEDSKLSEFDNHYIHLFDTKNPDAKLEPSDLKSCYFPAKLLFDPVGRNVFVRGTEYLEGEDGVYQPIEVISHVRLNLDEKGKPYFSADPRVLIRIKGVGTEFTSDAPVDMALAYNGKMLLYTNGATVFSYDVQTGYVSALEFIAPKDYSTNYAISHLSIDEPTNTLIVATSRRVEGEGGKVEYGSDIFFGKLESNGTLAPAPKSIKSFEFPEGVFLTPGSNAVIVSDSNSEPQFAYFVTNDGSLFQVDLRVPGVINKFDRIAVFGELAQVDNEKASPRVVSYDRVKRVLGATRVGSFVRIQRPANGRPGRPGRPGSIQRPANIRVHDTPGLALAQFNKKNKISRQQVFADELQDAGALSNVVFDGQASLFGATYSGSLFSIDLSDLGAGRLTSLGVVGSRVDHLAYNSARETFVAIDSFELDEQGLNIASSGSLVIARFRSDDDTQATSLFQIFRAEGSLLAIAAPKIQRPCGVRRR
jgi:hypothetical protein